ncbi:uncharacterized protein LOC129407030 [Sorex araneus]|uniref:uncharacterized protein LOC129407030 n=1 Tax=Sorex araneus TaxID=42254 RepID=UPI0024335E32|nr:uncharacterized protein LOC129407030 [Sorex araneus]
MACSPVLLLFLLAQYPGSWAQTGLMQEVSVSGSVGQTVTLTCTGTSSNVGSYGAGWYQQIPGAAPKTVMLGSTRPTGIPDRFTGSKSGNKASLTILGVQPEDEADYYCASYDYNINNATVFQTGGEMRQKPSSGLSDPPQTVRPLQMKLKFDELAAEGVVNQRDLWIFNRACRDGYLHVNNPQVPANYTSLPTLPSTLDSGADSAAMPSLAEQNLLLPVSLAHPVLTQLPSVSSSPGTTAMYPEKWQ